MEQATARPTREKNASTAIPGVVHAEGDEPLFEPGDHVRVMARSPIGHYRAPTYIRGKRAVVEAVIKPRAVNNEEEGFGHNAGSKRHYYRIAIAMTELWPGYTEATTDGLRIEVFETWLERR
jgi:nitrile hydratase